jgi:hypothetical protein
MLEDRLVPTVMFIPQFTGEEVVKDTNESALTRAQVNVLFEGASWNNDNTAPIASEIQAIVNSDYLSKLGQYRPDQAFNPGDNANGNVDTDPTALPAGFDPQGANIGDVNAMLTRAFRTPASHIAAPGPDGLTPDGRTPIYVVVADNPTLPPNSPSGFENGGPSFNRSNANTAVDLVSQSGQPYVVQLHEILINPFYLTNTDPSTGAVTPVSPPAINEDFFTVSFSHELAESISGSVMINQPSQFKKVVDQVGTQIADGEPDPLPSFLVPNPPNRTYSARLIGIPGTSPLVQAYWSQEDQGGNGAFVVPGAADVTHRPVWTDTQPDRFFTGNFDPPPGATTLFTSSVTSTGATFNAIVNPDGSATSTFFEYSTDPNLPANVVTTFAGSAGHDGSSDGAGAAARFNEPNGVAVDVHGNVYVADTSNDTIREITSGGVVTTLAGTAGVPGSVDGVGTAAQFNDPTAVAVDDAGNIYVADAGNDTIREIAQGGVVTTIAGMAGVADSADGVGAAAHFNHPSSVSVDGAGNVYVADTYNNTIREISPARVVTTLAGTPNVAGSADGVGAAALFDNPYGIAVDDAGNIYVGDTLNDTVREITPGGVVTTLAGTAGQAGNIDGTGAAARLNDPNGVAVDGAGNVYVADYGNHLIREITPAGVVTTLAGTVGETGGADGTGPAARFNRPTGVAVDGAGNVFVADTENDTIRKLSIPSVSAQSGLTGTNPVALTSAVTDLAPDTICYGRVVATNAGGTTLGAILSFTTVPVGPLDQGVPAGMNLGQANQFFNPTFAAPASVPSDWNGNVPNGVAGTLGTAYEDAILARINAYRAMAGIPTVTLDTTNSPKAQQAALMTSANNQVSHNPPPDFIDRTPAAVDGATNSNLDLGLSGIPAIDDYISDVNNIFGSTDPVGHRLWVLDSATQTMGVGDIPLPPTSGRPKPANAIYVVEPQASPLPDTAVAWPPAGFVPASLMPMLWSLQTDATDDFSAATVTVTVNGVSQPVQIIEQDSPTRPPDGVHTAIVWKFVNPHSPGPGQTVDTVNITNVTAKGQPVSFSYTTTSFTPTPTTAVTEAASAISTAGATLSASIDPNGNATIFSFLYGTDPTLTTGTEATPAQWAGSELNPQTEYAALTDLTPDTTYYFDVTAATPTGLSTGPILSFTTAGNPAVIQFSGARFTANVTDGTAQVVLSRAGNLTTAVTVVVSSSGGHDVSPFSETIAFGPNVLSQDVSIPVVNDGRPGEADLSLPVSLSAPSPGSAIGAASAATLVIHDNNPLPPAPTILSVRHPTIKVPSGKRSTSVTVLQLQFSVPVNGAGNLADYSLKSGKTKKGVTTYTVPVPLTAAVYNYRNSLYTAPRNTVTLFLKGKLNLATPERLSIIANSITDSFGRPLARHVVTFGNKGGVSIQWSKNASKLRTLSTAAVDHVLANR